MLSAVASVFPFLPPSTPFRNPHNPLVLSSPCFFFLLTLYCTILVGPQVPPHISHATAMQDVQTLANLFKEVWPGIPSTSNSSSSGRNMSAASAPRLYGTGTNDCQQNNNSDILSALVKDGVDSGISFHSYPANANGGWWNKTDLPSYLLNVTWLRHEVLAQTAPCIAAWNAGPRSNGMTVAVTEVRITPRFVCTLV